MGSTNVELGWMTASFVSDFGRIAKFLDIGFEQVFN